VVKLRLVATVTTKIHSDAPTETMRRVLTETAGESVRYLVNPTAEYLFALTIVGNRSDELEPVRVLGRREVVRQLRQDFTVGSRMSNLVDDDLVAIREGELDDETPMLVADNSVHTLVLLEETAGSVPSRDPAFVTEVFDACDQRWAAAEPYSIRIPPLRSLRVSMTARLGDPFRDGFETALDVAETLRDRTEFHPVRAAIVVAASERLLHYDLSKWGEDSGLASTASFSRHKTDLEDENVITTEKEPVEMGRPRQRLLLTDEYRRLLEDEGLTTVIERISE
jgi:hypothetical protein